MPWLFMVPAIAWKLLATLAIFGAAYLWAFNNGAEHNAKRVEKSNAKAVSMADKARSKSRAKSSFGGVRDPWSAD